MNAGATHPGICEFLQLINHIPKSGDEGLQRMVLGYVGYIFNLLCPFLGNLVMQCEVRKQREYRAIFSTGFISFSGNAFVLVQGGK